MDLRVYLDEDGLHFDFYDHDGVNATNKFIIYFSFFPSSKALSALHFENPGALKID